MYRNIDTDLGIRENFCSSQIVVKTKNQYCLSLLLSSAPKVLWPHRGSTPLLAAKNLAATPLLAYRCAHHASVCYHPFADIDFARTVTTENVRKTTSKGAVPLGFLMSIFFFTCEGQPL